MQQKRLFERDKHCCQSAQWLLKYDHLCETPEPKLPLESATGPSGAKGDLEMPAHKVGRQESRGPFTSIVRRAAAGALARHNRRGPGQTREPHMWLARSGQPGLHVAVQVGREARRDGRHGQLPHGGRLPAARRGLLFQQGLTPRGRRVRGRVLCRVPTKGGQRKGSLERQVIFITTHVLPSKSDQLL